MELTDEKLRHNETQILTGSLDSIQITAAELVCEGECVENVGQVSSDAAFAQFRPRNFVTQIYLPAFCLQPLHRWQRSLKTLLMNCCECTRWWRRQQRPHTIRLCINEQIGPTSTARVTFCCVSWRQEWTRSRKPSPFVAVYDRAHLMCWWWGTAAAKMGTERCGQAMFAACHTYRPWWGNSVFRRASFVDSRRGFS